MQLLGFRKLFEEIHKYHRRLGKFSIQRKGVASSSAITSDGSTMKLLLIIVATWVSVFGAKKTSKADLSNGFRTDIDWVHWDNAIGVAKDLNKPIFLLIHKTWCGACKGLQREFSNSPKMSDLIELSKKFVMVNTEDDDEPEDEKYAPDGGYIPRILFLDTDAEPLKTNNEAKYKNNKYFYPLVPQVVDGMKRALDEFEAKSGSNKDALKSDTSKDSKKKDEEDEKDEDEQDDSSEEKESISKDNEKEKKEEKKEKKDDKKEKKEDTKDKKDDKTEKKEDTKDKKDDKKEKKVEKDHKKEKKQVEKNEDKENKKTENKKDKQEKSEKKEDKSEKTKKEKKGDDSSEEENVKSKGKDGKKKAGDAKKDDKKKKTEL
ncbi:ThioredoXin Domain Containing protein [Trichostrongylus colubriformis]|uniref:ThioredoXin Domain Containing protein n=1 Tax=Trichostrongylus colubriformis TaxID=6319 RepID=A0AAN8EPU0_TRICO